MHFFILFFILFCDCETFASLEEVIDPYGKGEFLPKRAMSFELDESALSLPDSECKRTLARTLIKNDRKLMFYLSKNKGLSFSEKLSHRLQAFQYVVEYYNSEFETSTETLFQYEENFIPLIPLFQFTGGDWIRLQGIVCGNHGSMCFIIMPDKKLRAECRDKTIIYESCFKEPYYRFLSNKEQKIRGGGSSIVPRDQREQSDRTPQPRSLRKKKYRGSWY